jgi:hypothetical protein
LSFNLTRLQLQNIFDLLLYKSNVATRTNNAAVKETGRGANLALIAFL